MKCKRCGTTLRSKTIPELKKIAKALGQYGIPSSGVLYWCPKCYPKKVV